MEIVNFTTKILISKDQDYEGGDGKSSADVEQVFNITWQDLIEKGIHPAFISEEFIIARNKVADTDLKIIDKLDNNVDIRDSDVSKKVIGAVGDSEFKQALEFVDKKVSHFASGLSKNSED